MIRNPNMMQGLVTQIREFVQDVAIPNEDRVEAENRPKIFLGRNHTPNENKKIV